MRNSEASEFTHKSGASATRCRGAYFMRMCKAHRERPTAVFHATCGTPLRSAVFHATFGTQKQPCDNAMRFVFLYMLALDCKQSRGIGARPYFMPPSALKSNLATTLRVLFFYICSRLTASSRAAYIKKQPYGCFARLFFRLVPAVGLEPTRMISPQDFESSASASFTTPAQE